MGNQRALFRIALKRRGELRRESEAAPCEVIDLTEKGVRFETELQVAVGEQLRLSFGLTNTWTIHCTIQVTRVNHPHVGACIRDMSPEDQQHLSQFIEQLNVINLTGF